jgi:hypothetical protein
LLLLNESSPHQVSAGIRSDLIVLQATDRAIYFQHGQSARAQCDLRRDAAAREKHSVQLAVTGTGAPLGVLKYPVAFFLSTFHTTSSKSK